MASKRRATGQRARKAHGAHSRPSRPASTGTAAAAAKTIQSWEDDPCAEAITVPVAARPIARPVPVTTGPGGRLPFRISGSAPAVRKYTPGTAGFRYWTATEALARAVDFWSQVLPPAIGWAPSVGPRLTVELDKGEDMNAYYTREGLEFFHATVGRKTVYSGESPDILCHELGHAVLDALKPDLWDAANLEAPAFHESFGDMSALLSALQLPSVRQTILRDTGGRLYVTSRVSRLAEQLGWAIRQGRPDSAEPDCLRNAVNSFFYTDPSKLPPVAPASALSSRPHSFSRVFTGAFFEGLAGMVRTTASTPADADVVRATKDAGFLLADGISGAGVVPEFFSQVAAAILAADVRRFSGKYSDVLKSAFVRHGVLALASAGPFSQPSPVPPRPASAFGNAGPAAPGVSGHSVGIDAAGYGLKGAVLYVQTADAPRRFAVASAAADLGPAQTHDHAEAARFFVEDLFRRGRIDVRGQEADRDRLVHPFSNKTHRIVDEAKGPTLRRTRFDCGLDAE